LIAFIISVWARDLPLWHAARNIDLKKDQIDQKV